MSCNLAEQDPAASQCVAAMLHHSPVNILLLVFIALGRVVALTVFADGLLGIGISLDNPLGDDPADLPGLAYQLFMRDECKAFGVGVDAVTLHEGAWWRGVQSRKHAGGTDIAHLSTPRSVSE